MVARNPYIAGNPVGGGPAFVGRDDVLREVRRVLGDPQHQGIVLFGQRRIGKTSILRELAAWLPKNGGPRAIYFDLLDKASRPVGAILVDLAGKIAAKLDLPAPKPEGDAEAWFRDTWLPPVLERLPEGESLAVLLDEFDVLADAEAQKAASESFFGYLRELLEKVAPRLRLVFVIGRNLEELSYLVGPLFRALPKAHVSLLSREEAEAVARLSEKNGSLAWSPEAVARVWALTHGHPYLLQHLAWHVWQRAHEGGTTERAVVAEDVDAAAPAAIDASDNALDWLWDGLPPAAKVVAAALAKAGDGVISEKQLEATLKESGVRVLLKELQEAPALLGKWDVVEPVDGGHRFRVELLRRWIAKNKPPALVQKELDRIEPQAELLYKSGEGFYKSGDLRRAVQQLQMATRLNNNHRRANELLAEIHISQGAWADARWVLETLAENYPAQAKPRLVQVLLALASEAGEEGAKLDLYEQVLKLDPEHGAANEGRRALYKARGDRAVGEEKYAEALLAYSAAGRADLADQVSLTIQKQLLGGVQLIVDALERSEQYGKALEEIRRAQEEHPGLKEWAPEIARIEREQEVAADYQRALGAIKERDAETSTELLAKVVGARPKYKDAAKLLYETVSGERVDDLKKRRRVLGRALVAYAIVTGPLVVWLSIHLAEKPRTQPVTVPQTPATIAEEGAPPPPPPATRPDPSTAPTSDGEAGVPSNSASVTTDARTAPTTPSASSKTRDYPVHTITPACRTTCNDEGEICKSECDPYGDPRSYKLCEQSCMTKVARCYATCKLP